MEIDDKLLRRITKQLRILRVMMTFLFLIGTAMLAILIFMAYTVITFTQHVNNKIDTIEQTTTQKLDVKSQLCDNATSTIAKQLCQ